MDEVDVTIIGAGVVGLAVAAELSHLRRTIVVLEKAETYGQETSSRNSGVIHSGIYYPTGSLKARLCIEGAGLLYDICRTGRVPHLRTGKLIVAADQSELAGLEALFETGTRNGLRNMSIIGKDEIRKIEPAVIARAGIHLSDTGIIDAHALMKRFYQEAAANQVLFAFNSSVDRLEKERDAFSIRVRQEQYRFSSRVVINCAGLASDRIAAMAGLDVDKLGYRLRYCKGSYFSYAKPSPVRMLVYPLPHDALTGLGVHATLDLGGRLRFGPDAEYINAVSYSVDAARRDLFFESAKRIIWGLEKTAFLPDMAGIRPKLQGPGEPVRDFIIANETVNGLPGLINLIGIESPGLTAAPAIARLVSGIVKAVLN